MSTSNSQAVGIVIQDDGYESAMTACRNLEYAISTLCATGLEPFFGRHRKLLDQILDEDDFTSIQERLDREERLHAWKNLPPLHQQCRARVAELDKEITRLEAHNVDANRDMIQILIGIKDQATAVIAATGALLKLANPTSTLGKRKRAHRSAAQDAIPLKIQNCSSEQDPLAFAAERCCDLGGALKALDELLTSIVERCDHIYEENLKRKNSLEQASRNRTVQQYMLILQELPVPVETAQRCRGEFVEQMKEVRGFLKLGGRVDEDVYGMLRAEWNDQLEGTKFFERILRRAAYGVLQATM